MARIKVLISGAVGKMGSEVVRAVLKEKDMEIVGAVDKAEIGKDAGLLAKVPEIGIKVEADLGKAIQNSKPDVVVDFTHPSTVMENIKVILANKARPIVGTTGIKEDDLPQIKKMAKDAGLPVIIAPNFAVGAILMMRSAAEIAKYMPNVEIIEMHHDQKADAPSGTAIKTAKLISNAVTVKPPRVEGKETIKNVRGGNIDNIRIHSVRLPGFVAHQEIIFGGDGQTLTMRHDSISRESFMPGVVLSIREIMKSKDVIYGLENIL
ncbi:MAG: 4-hydroxy-tetrahydrodipicolinate reductase [bacterium]